MSIEIKLYASECGRNLGYLERIRRIAEELKLNYSLEHISDEILIENHGISVPCMFLYCLGCEAATANVKESEPDAICAPALEVNSKVLLWDKQASDEQLRTILLPYKQS